MKHFDTLLVRVNVTLKLYENLSIEEIKLLRLKIA